MRIIRSFDEITAPLPGAVVTIGNFDGVHLGHREIFRRVVRRAEELGGTSVVLTFVPHPLKVLAPERAPQLISTAAEKERLIEASCIEVLLSVPFTRALAALPAARFVEELLVGKIGVRHLIVGYDYAFGRGREGNVDFLRRKGEALGFEVEVLKPIVRGREVYSSSRIRQMIGEGRVEDVVEFLGRHFTLEGTVVHGDKRGKSLGFPTANLCPEKELLPRPGVYAVKVKRGEKVFDGVVNIGSTPTFRAEGSTVEIHILDFQGEIYGETLRLYFVKRLRDEKTFSGAEALIEAIGRDIRQARTILAATRIVEYHEYLDCGTSPTAPFADAGENT